VIVMPRRTLDPKFKIVISGGKHFATDTTRRIIGEYNRWMESIYPIIVSETPMYSGNDPRRSPGFVKGSIKLMVTMSSGLRTKTVGVPGGDAKGTPAYNAWHAVRSLHEGWRGPFTRYPKGKVLTFPLKRGTTFKNPMTASPPLTGSGKGKKQWVITTKSVQKTGPKPNPWVERIIDRRFGDLVSMINNAIKKQSKVKEELK